MLHSRSHGTTLVELTLALGILGLLIGLAAAPISRARDVFAVRAARDAIVAASSRARAYAVHHGGAELRVDAATGAITVSTRDAAVTEVSRLPAEVAVQVKLQGTTATVAIIPYDALGIGRLANRTISLQRGSTSGGVTFSAYGRPRPW